MLHQETAPQGSPAPPPAGTFPTPNTPQQQQQADTAAAQASGLQGGLVTAPGAFFAFPPPGQEAGEAEGTRGGAGQGVWRIGWMGGWV
eukprot:1161508-Pelagomonas_calceolata.AAC.3